jgi:hypothetical protein
VGDAGVLQGAGEKDDDVAKTRARSLTSRIAGAGYVRK